MSTYFNCGILYLTTKTHIALILSVVGVLFYFKFFYPKPEFQKRSKRELSAFFKKIHLDYLLKE